jgi:hypothetical protein
VGDLLLGQYVPQDTAMANDNARRTLQHAFGTLTAPAYAADDLIETEQRASSEQPTRYGLVIGD